MCFFFILFIDVLPFWLFHILESSVAQCWNLPIAFNIFIYLFRFLFCAVLLLFNALLSSSLFVKILATNSLFFSFSSSLCGICWRILNTPKMLLFDGKSYAETRSRTHNFYYNGWLFVCTFFFFALPWR